MRHFAQFGKTAVIATTLGLALWLGSLSSPDRFKLAANGVGGGCHCPLCKATREGRIAVGNPLPDEISNLRMVRSPWAGMDVGDSDVENQEDNVTADDIADAREAVPAVQGDRPTASHDPLRRTSEYTARDHRIPSVQVRPTTAATTAAAAAATAETRLTHALTDNAHIRTP